LATKTSVKKESSRSESARPKIDKDAIALVTDEFLVQQVYQAIIAHGEPAKLADVQKSLDDESVSLGLIRQTLISHPQRFLQVDRRWDVSTRYLDSQRPAIRIIEEILTAFGSPMAAWDAAHELGLVYHRSTEGQQVIAERILGSSELFFAIPSGTETKFGMKSWLLDIQDSYKTLDNILFYNYLPVDALKPFHSLKLDWETAPVESAVKVIAAVHGKPGVVDNRLLLLLAYQELEDDFDQTAIYAAFAKSPELIALPGHRWTDAAGAEALREQFRKLSQTIAENPVEEEVEVEPSVPLSITPADLAEIERILADSTERAIHATELLEQLYETAPGDPSFDADLAILVETLNGAADQFEWVGYDWYRPLGSLPPYIGQVPETLQFPIVPLVETPEGDVLDQLIEDEGFERGLEREILSPYAQDVNDQEKSEETLWPEGHSLESQTIRLIIKAHHKEIFTFPLCQIPPEFIASTPKIVEVTLRDTSGRSYQVFADNETQLVYGLGLFDLYADITADSGAVVYIQKTSTPGEFLFINKGETDAEYYVSPERLQFLQDYRAEVESGPSAATYDLVRYILEHANSAMSYASILTELNIVRRVRRRQLASILSAWSGFSARAGLWSFDPKKAAQGFNKAKRKYVISS
jgi:hypothetical protein